MPISMTKGQSFSAKLIANPEGLPSLFHRSVYEFVAGGREAFANAFVPSAINLQWTDGKVAAVAKQFGPRDADDKDVFEEKIREILGAQTVFIDTWDRFHLNFGQVHCGSAAVRTPDPSWWTK